MTSRERFRETMRYGRPDRVPYFEDGIRDEVLAAWREQGLPPDADLATLFPTDRRERLPVNLDSTPAGERAIPSRANLKASKRSLDPDAPGRLPDDWAEKVRAWRDRDHLLELWVHQGFFLTMGVRDWATFEPVVYLLEDDPDLVREVMGARAHLAATMADRVLAEVDVDLALFSEPIGGNNGPLLGPRHYREFVLASYQPVLDVLRRHSVATICLVTYANARALVPSILEAGFNCLWACEVNADAMDYLALRQQFGRDLRLIGGIDLDALLGGPEAIRREIERAVPRLLEDGGYVPLADGRVRGNVPFEHYAYYRRLLAEVTGGAG
jgi:uroporphyrinogen decarboxylase